MILCLGTTPTMQRTMVFNQLRIDDVNRAVKVVEYASGKNVNVARVAKELGEEVGVIGFAGGDRGKALRHGVAEAGMRDFFVETQAQTRLCTTVVDRAGGTATELIEEPLAVEEKAWEELDHAMQKHAKDASVIVCSGSLAPGGTTDLYAKPVERSLPHQQVIIDGRGDLVRNALRHRGFVLKINQEELSATLCCEIADEKQLREAMFRACPEDGAIIVTMGKAGAMALRDGTFTQISVPEVKVVSAIGSGDAFAAGLAVGLARNMNWSDTIRLAAACGCANAMTPLAGQIHHKDVAEILPKIALT